MTILVALHDPRTERTWIGSDTLGQYNHRRIGTGPKWVVRDGLAGAASGHLRTINLLHAAMPDLIPIWHDRGAVALRLREMLRDDGYKVGPTDDDTVPHAEEDFVLADAERVRVVDCGFATWEIAAGDLQASGSGEHFALGAAHALRAHDPSLSPDKIVRAALAAAMDLDVGCGGEMWLAALG